MTMALQPELPVSTSEDHGACQYWERHRSHEDVRPRRTLYRRIDLYTSVISGMVEGWDSYRNRVDQSGEYVNEN